MASSKLGKGALAASAAGLLIAGGGAIAYAATGDSTSTTTPTSTASSSTSSGLPSLDNGQGANNGRNNGQTGQQAPQGGMGRGGMGDGQGMGGHAHTAVTGDELTKVKDAVKAKDSAVTVTQVMKDEDGSYDAFGTKDGQMVRVEVSADLKTVEVGQGGMGRGGMGDGQGMGGHAHTAVTGDELTKVKDAIKAKDSAVTVTQVMKDEDGSYDAFGTKDGQMVRVEVSADLKTVEVGQGGPGMGRGGMGGHHGGGMPGQAPGQSGSSGGSGTLPVPTPSGTTSNSNTSFT